MKSKNNILRITLHGRTYTLNEFCKLYEFSYSTAYRKYQQGLRDEKLFDALAEGKFSKYVVLGKPFRTLKEAANHFSIPYTTFLRKYKNGTLSNYLHNKQIEDNSS